jgi:MerR family transcriptional regulator, copper efflux regulator
MAPGTLRIGQLARAGGVSAKTIRYYERVGVLPPAGRTAAGYRQYTERGVQRLRFVRRARALGLPLHHLKALTAALDAGPRGAVRPRLRALVQAQLSAVRRQSSDLRLLQHELRQVLRRLHTTSGRNRAGECRCLGAGEDALRP